MIYKFKSKAAGDVIMMGANGDQVLRVIGKTPAPKGIIEPRRDAGGDRGDRGCRGRRRGAAQAGDEEAAAEGRKPGAREASRCASAPGRWSR